MVNLFEWLRCWVVRHGHDYHLNDELPLYGYLCRRCGAFIGWEEMWY